MQKFTRFYGKVAYLGMISDFSTSLRFLFYELISGFQILISVISPRAYEISPSVGPLGLLHKAALWLMALWPNGTYKISISRQTYVLFLYSKC